MKFTSMSGNVHVKLKGSLDANVELLSSSGRIETDFPTKIRIDNLRPRRRVQFRAGTGSGSIRLESKSGHVSLTELR